MGTGTGSPLVHSAGSTFHQNQSIYCCKFVCQQFYHPFCSIFDGQNWNFAVMPIQRPKESIPAQTQLPALMMVVRMLRRRPKRQGTLSWAEKSVADWAGAE